MEHHALGTRVPTGDGVAHCIARFAADASASCRSSARTARSSARFSELQGHENRQGTAQRRSIRAPRRARRRGTQCAKRWNETGSFASPEAQRAQAQRVSAQHSRFNEASKRPGGGNSFRAARGRQRFSRQRTARGHRRSARLPGVPRSAPSKCTSRQYRQRAVDRRSRGVGLGGPGEGVRIGIIDSGIDYTHADFGGSGNPSDYAATIRTSWSRALSPRPR